MELSEKQYKDWERQQRERAEEEPAQTLKWRKGRQRARPLPGWATAAGVSWGCLGYARSSSR